MSAWKAIVAAIVIFIAGGVTGALVSRSLLKSGAVSPGNPYPPAMGMAQRLEYIRRLEAQLILTHEQKAGVEQALRESQDRMKTLWESISPEMRRELQSAREKIQALLTPEQNAKYQELMKARPGRKYEEGREPHWDRRRDGEFSGRGGNRPTNDPPDFRVPPPATNGLGR